MQRLSPATTNGGSILFSFLPLPNILGILQSDRADAVSKWQLVLNNLIWVSDWDARQSWTRDATPRVQIQRGSGNQRGAATILETRPTVLLKESRLLEQYPIHTIRARIWLSEFHTSRRDAKIWWGNREGETDVRCKMAVLHTGEHLSISFASLFQLFRAII